MINKKITKFFVYNTFYIYLFIIFLEIISQVIILVNNDIAIALSTNPFLNEIFLLMLFINIFPFILFLGSDEKFRNNNINKTTLEITVYCSVLLLPNFHIILSTI